MSARALHKLIGILLVLPFLGWISTGVVFLIKPGYESAYGRLSLQTYPMTALYTIVPEPRWQEMRILRSTLGDHLLVRSGESWQHLNPANRQPWAEPDENSITALLQDAADQHPERYGKLTHKEGEVFVTDSGVELSLDWNSLTVEQRGRDTRLIGLLYRIHYLEWFGSSRANLALGVAGLGALFLLLICGLVLLSRSGRD